MKRNNENQKLSPFQTVLITVLTLLIMGFIFKDSFVGFFEPRSNIKSVAEEEAEYRASKIVTDIAYLRYAISESELKSLENPKKGYATIPQTVFDSIGQYVKEVDYNNKWFGNSNLTFTGKMLDNSDQDITKISDGNYVATFIKNKNDSKINYIFEEGNISNGAKLFISSQ